KLQFALPSHELHAFEKRSRLRPFTLGLPFIERYRFPLDIVEKFDLHPRLVVANADAFFIDAETLTAQQVVEGGWWAGVTTVVEERLAVWVWPTVSRLLPSLVVRRPPQYLLRSRSDGAWLAFGWPHSHDVPASYGIDLLPTERAVASAVRFRDALAGHGAR